MGHKPVVLRGKFIALQAYLKIRDKSQINNLTLHLKELEKERQTQSKMSRSKEIIKVRAEINKIESKKIQKINKAKSWFFKKINQIDKHLTTLIKKQRIQINKIRNEGGELRTDSTELQRIVEKYYEQLNATCWTIWKKWINS